MKSTKVTSTHLARLRGATSTTLTQFGCCLFRSVALGISLWVGWPGGDLVVGQVQVLQGGRKASKRSDGGKLVVREVESSKVRRKTREASRNLSERVVRQVERHQLAVVLVDAWVQLLLLHDGDRVLPLVAVHHLRLIQLGDLLLELFCVPFQVGLQLSLGLDGEVVNVPSKVTST